MRLALWTVVLVIVTVVVFPGLIAIEPGGSGGGGKPTLHRGEDVPVRLFLQAESRVRELSLEEYVKGVVAAEMPAEFEPEALKAQAVAARTYAVKSMRVFGGSGLADHPGADVTDDPRTGQAWLSQGQLQNRWGAEKYDRYWAKVSRAVDETRGLILIFNGEPIHAVFHSTSGERTASAREVWGFDYPYLQSVVCSWDRKSPRYTDSREFALSDLEGRLGSDAGILTAAQGGNRGVAQILELTESGRVEKIRIGSKTFSGNSLRQKLELRSTNFKVEVQGEKVVIRTVGNGHGVGLCQYGANGMAKEGRDYRQILTYYYTGVAFKHIFGS